MHLGSAAFDIFGALNCNKNTIYFHGLQPARTLDQKSKEEPRLNFDDMLVKLSLLILNLILGKYFEELPDKQIIFNLLKIWFAVLLVQLYVG